MGEKTKRSGDLSGQNFGTRLLLVFFVSSLLGFFVFTLKDLFWKAPDPHDSFQGQMIPDIEVLNQRLEPVSSQSFPSHEQRLIVFWATWCAPCVEEIGMLLSETKKNPSLSKKFLFLNVDAWPLSEILSKNRSWQEEHKLHFDSFFDPEMALLSALRVSALPFSLLLSADEGKISWMKMAPLEKSDLKPLLLN